MKTIIGFFLLFICSLCYGQQAKVGKSYKRFDGSIGYSLISNYVVFTSAMDSSLYSVQEYYRFTTPKVLRLNYIIDRDGRKQGLYSKYNRNGNMIRTGRYEDDERTGEWMFLRNAKLYRRTYYNEGKRNGYTRYYYKRKEVYSWNRKNDKSEGYNVSKFNDGSIKREGLYNNGKREGLFKTYSKNGQITVIRNYVKDTLNGEVKRYYDTGILKMKGSYIMGVPSGSWEWHRENSMLASKEEYNRKGELKDVKFYDLGGVIERDNKFKVLKDKIDNLELQRNSVTTYVSENYVFPEELKNKGFESKVVVNFIIDTLGYPQQIKISSDGPKYFEEAAEKLISSIPKQVPRLCHNILINSEYKFDIHYKFKLSDE